MQPPTAPHPAVTTQVGSDAGDVLPNLPTPAQYSRYVARCYQAHPALASWVEGQRGQPMEASSMAALLASYGASHDEASLKSALRRLRREVMCVLIDRDLSGYADFAEVAATMTNLAELCVATAVAKLDADLRARYGTPLGKLTAAPQTLLVVGMGKLGGRELNASSDIDLIFLYAEDGETRGATRTLSNHEYFALLGRRLIHVLSDVTADGFVFRVDMRLRPNGDAGPLACSFTMLEEYLLVQGREWERYAWIKARIVSPLDTEASSQLDALVAPFVYRRYLDYGVIASLRDLHRQIRAEAARRDQTIPGKQRAPGTTSRHDIKLGSGGIREIEFIAQVFQLMRGGQDFSMRIRPTLSALVRAAERGWLPTDMAATLSSSYLFLRKLEHRLQYLDDAQTHVLPDAPGDLEQVALAMGAPGYADFLDTLNHYQQPVATLFDAIFSDKSTDQPPSHAESTLAIWGPHLDDPDIDATLLEQLAALGFSHPAQAAERLRATWRSSRYRALSDTSSRKFDWLIPRIIALAAQQIGPDDTLHRFLALLEAISGRASYLSLLCEYPDALNRVAHTVQASRWAANYLTRHPQLLDELLDTRSWPDDAGLPAYWEAFKHALRERLHHVSESVEQQMDALRQAHHAETFRVLLQDLQGDMPVEKVSDRLSALADTVLDVTVEAVWRQLPSRKKLSDTNQPPRFAIIAYGKLGGKELGYGSDLDVIFLYDDSDEHAAEVYSTLARRLLVWLTSHTAAGTLFDIDTRLRPDGAAGMLVTSVSAFRRYQLDRGENVAWVWEQQALTRARFCAGDTDIGAAFEAIRVAVLRQSREANSLRADVCAMRQRVLDGHPNPTALFDLKHDRGGMVDIEFTVQYLVLMHSAAHPELTGNIGNIALLQLAGTLGLIDTQLGDQAANAYRIFRARQHVARLEGEEHPRVPVEQIEVFRQSALRLWHAVLETTG